MYIYIYHTLYHKLNVIEQIMKNKINKKICRKCNKKISIMNNCTKNTVMVMHNTSTVCRILHNVYTNMCMKTTQCQLSVNIVSMNAILKMILHEKHRVYVHNHKNFQMQECNNSRYEYMYIWCFKVGKLSSLTYCK